MRYRCLLSLVGRVVYPSVCKTDYNRSIRLPDSNLIIILFNMTLKLYQKENKLWYFHRLGSEWPIGSELSKVLSFYDSIENNKTIYIKIEKPKTRIKPIAVFQCMGFLNNIYGDVASDLIYLINNPKCSIPFSYNYGRYPGWFYITRIW